MKRLLKNHPASGLPPILTKSVQKSRVPTGLTVSLLRRLVFMIPMIRRYRVKNGLRVKLLRKSVSMILMIRRRRAENGLKVKKQSQSCLRMYSIPKIKRLK